MVPQYYKRHGEAFLSRISTGDETWFFHNTPESKVELMTWKHLHSPVKKKFKTVQSPGKMMATVFSVVCGLSSGWFDTSQFNNKCSCLSGNSEETQGGYLAEETRMLTKGVLGLQYSAQPHSAAAIVNFLNSWGWEVFPHPPSGPDFLCWTSICSQRWKNTSDVSVLPLRWICSKWSQELLTCLVHIFVYEEFDKLIYHCDTCLNRLCDCVG